MTAMYLYLVAKVTTCVFVFSPLQHLNELEMVDESQFQSAKMTINLPKNRFQNILPCKPQVKTVFTYVYMHVYILYMLDSPHM